MSALYPRRSAAGLPGGLPGGLPISSLRHRLNRCLLLVAGLALLAWFGAIFPTPAQAWTVEQHPDEVTGQVTISPTKYDLQMKPGETASPEIRVSNRTGKSQTIQFSVEDFEGSLDPSQATVFMGDEDSTWGARNWLEPELTSVVLSQGETLIFKTKVTVPKGAEPGGHYAVVFASTDTEATDEQGSAINITSRVGCLFLITVAGNIVEDGNLGPLEAPAFAEYGPVELGLVFNNTGNVHSKPSGHIVITNILGQTVADIPVNEWVVLPESSRRNLVEWDQHYLFGRYTAKAEIDYGDGQKVVVSESFWAFPWKIIAAVAVVLGGLIALISILMVRRKRARRARQAEVEQLRAYAAGEVPPPVAAPVEGPAMEGAGRQNDNLVPLNVLLPSIEDDSVVDISDPETQKLIRELIESQLDLARSFISEGRPDEARRELMEAQSAAQRVGLFFELGVIDDMLRSLS